MNISTTINTTATIMAITLATNSNVEIGPISAMLVRPWLTVEEFGIVLCHSIEIGKSQCQFLTNVGGLS
jgi:hypothetical protein